MAEIGEIIDKLKKDAPALIKDNLALARSELQPAAKHAGVGGGMFGGAGYVGLNALSLLFMAGGFGFGLLFASLWSWGPLLSACVGFVAMALVLLIIAGILALLGKGEIDKVEPPKATIAEAKATKDALAASIRRGQSAAVSGQTLTPNRSIRS